MKIVAIIPMKHISERVPGKNYRDFAGKPLFFYIIETLLKSKLINKVVINTDSQVIKNLINDNFKNTLVLDLPKLLKSGTTSMNDVLLNTINKVDADLYLQTHCTNPLLTIKSVDLAISKFLESNNTFDSLFSVTRKHVRLWDSLTRPINHNQNILLRTQDLPPIYEENSCMYIFTKDVLVNNHNRIGKRPLMFEIPEIETQDIDNEIDFKVAEILLKDISK